VSPATAPRLVALKDGPVSLTLVRHAESLGNLANNEALGSGAAHLDLDTRDADVDLSDNGKRQADALGAWCRRAAEQERPTLVITSPYRRAADTASRTIGETGIDLVVDERLRERDLGLFDGLTGVGIRAQYAEESQRRQKIGKFYYRPPSGESWADVVLRVRSLLTDLRTGYAEQRVWLVTHQAVIMSFRYVLEGLNERDLLDVSLDADLPNASLTTYRRVGSGLELDRFSDAGIVEEAAARVTHERSAAHPAQDESDA
jgi:broad specificity phosphatase PhoE